MNDEHFRFSDYKDENEKETLINFVSRLDNIYVSEKDWYKAMLGYEIMDSKIISIKKLTENAGLYISQYLKKNISAIEWDIELIKAAMCDEVLSTSIKAQEIAIFYNQNKTDIGLKKLFTVKQLQRDGGIPEIIKDVSEELDGIVPMSPTLGYRGLQVRKFLLNNAYDDEIRQMFTEYEELNLSEYISAKINSSFKVHQYEYNKTQYNAICYKSRCLMISCGENKEVYDLYKKIIGDKMPEYNPVSCNKGKSAFFSAYRAAILYMSAIVESYVDFSAFKIKFFAADDENSLYDFINKLLNQNVKYGTHLSKSFLPNRNGKFSPISNLRLNTVSDDVLVNILDRLEITAKNNTIFTWTTDLLLDKKITIQGVDISYFNIFDCCEKIAALLSSIMAKINLCDAGVECQDACSKLLLWIQTHIEKSQNLFPSYCSELDQMKLLTPQTAVRMQNKVNQIQDMLDKYGVNDISALGELIERSGPADNSDCLTTSDSVFLDFDYCDLSRDDLEKVCREVGILGEESAFEYLCSKLEKNGFSVKTKDSMNAELISEAGEKVTVIKPDTSDYHQSGWDIKVITESGDNITTIFYEIKTHTPKSKYINQIRLSNEQMKKAISERDKYTVLRVIYDY